jgi:hypothetical protein
MYWYRQRHRRVKEPISASEIACFAYCPEAWRLQYGLGLPADNQAAMNVGVRHHQRQALLEWLAGWAISLGQAIIVAALVTLLLWVLSL